MRRRRPRRAVVAVAAGAVLLLAGTALGTALPHGRDVADAYDQPLRVLAQRHDLAVGAAVDADLLADVPAYRRTVAQQLSSLTPELAMKWDAVEPERGTLDFDDADALVAFAEDHDQEVHGHTLVWQEQNPQWLVDGVADGSIGAAELRGLLRDHIRTEVSRYAGRVGAWDVVNEAVGDDGGLRQDLWLDTLGQSYIADALRWAHEADPDAKLYLNDYNVEDVDAKSDRYYALAKQLLDDGVPLDGIGIQAHLTTSAAPTTLRENIRRFADLGLEVALTEVDVRAPVPAGPTELLAQAEVFGSVLADCLAEPACVSYTTWGVTDAHSWVPGRYPGYGAALLLDASYDPKPAFRAVQRTLAVADGLEDRG